MSKESRDELSVEPLLEVEPLSSHHNRNAFCCGNPALDNYLKTQARQDLRRNVAAPFVLVHADDKSIVRGYYTLSAFGVELAELPDDTARKLPGYPIVPAALLGRLAVGESHRGQGHGEFLLMDALYRVCQQAQQIAIAMIIVDAIDDNAQRFYSLFNFLSFPKRKDRLFLPMKTAEKLF